MHPCGGDDPANLPQQRAWRVGCNRTALAASGLIPATEHRDCLQHSGCVPVRRLGGLLVNLSFALGRFVFVEDVGYVLYQLSGGSVTVIADLVAAGIVIDPPSGMELRQMNVNERDRHYITRYLGDSLQDMRY